MAAINFPSSPQVDDTFVAGEVTYIWDGVKWKANTYVPESVSEVLDTKQDTLVSGTNIKTVNGNSLVGSGDVTISAGAAPQVAALANNDSQNYKVPFFKTTGNTSGDYQVCLDSDANQFNYNPGSNVLDNVNLGSNTSVQKIVTTATSDNANFKVTFANTTSNSSGQYTQLTDSSSNFTYNPSTNTLNSVVLGSSVSLPNASTYSVGGVYGYTPSSGGTSFGYGSSVASSSTAIGISANAGNYNYAVALGESSTADSAYSLAFGRLAWAGYQGSAAGSISIGHNTSSRYSNVPSTLIGHQVYSGNVTSGDGVVAIRGGNGSSVWDIPGSGFYVDTITAATASNALYYDTTTKKITYGAAASGGEALDDLSDVTITSPTSGQVLLYNGTTWVNGTAGEEPPPAADVYRSTLIAPQNVFVPNSTTMFVAFATAEEATHVRALMVAIGSDYSSGTVDFRYNGQYFRINFDSNVSSWVSVSSSTLEIYNYYAYNGGSWPGSNQVAIRAVPYGASGPSDSSQLAIGGNSIGTQLVTATAFGNWKPFSVEWYQGNFAPSAIVVAPSASPTLTPAVSSVTAPNAGTALFSFDVANNPPATFSYSDAPPYVQFVLGKTVLVDPNAPVPWYTVQGAQGSAPINGTIALPAGYDSAQLGSGHKFVGIGNCHNFSGGSQYFYVYGPGMTSGPSIGNPYSNNNSVTYFTTSGMSSPVSYDQQGLGIVSVFAQPIPSNSGALCAYTKGNTSYAGPPGGFFGEYYSGYLVNDNPGSPPSGGTVKFKSVMMFTNPVTVELFSTYASASGILLETFNYTDQYYGNTTRYVFFTCTNDTVARQMAADTNPILEFKNSPGGSNAQVTHLAWSWFERTA